MALHIPLANRCSDASEDDKANAVESHTEFTEVCIGEIASEVMHPATVSDSPSHPPANRGYAAHRTFYSWKDLQHRLDDDGNIADASNGLHSFSDGSLAATPLAVANPGAVDSRLNTSQELVLLINRSIIGASVSFQSPYGRRRVLYADYIASGKSLTFIEDYIRDQVLPTYANTHSTGTLCSLQTTMFRHEARQIIRNATNASADDAVIFCGSGSTAALNKLIRCMSLSLTSSSVPVFVFCSAYEHHSNLLPWRETGAKIHAIGERINGDFDYDALEAALADRRRSMPNCLLIGSSTACSNVTGVMLDVNRVSRMLHRYNALALFDYAACAPYVLIDMNPIERDCAKDAIIMSMHKFIGGPQTPGVLIVKKRLLTNLAPEVCGGGTVFFVTDDSHRYLLDAETREEGGTPAIVESIRAGLIMKLKESVGVEAIMLREQVLWLRARARLLKMKNVLVLGSLGAEKPVLHSEMVSCFEPNGANRLPIISFVIQHAPTGLLLHHHFVVAVLNDVFGVQMRGGCMCAGPYAQRLLGIDATLARRFEAVLLEDARINEAERRGPVAPPREFSVREHLRPGFVRFNLPYYVMDSECDFILDALELVSERGWQLLPQYLLNPETGEWHHRDQSGFRERKWLSSVSFAGSSTTFKFKFAEQEQKAPGLDFASSVIEAREKILSHDVCRQLAFRSRTGEQFHSYDDETKQLLWFLMPDEAGRILLSDESVNVAAKKIVTRAPVFVPRSNIVAEIASIIDEKKVTNIDKDLFCSIAKSELHAKLYSGGNDSMNGGDQNHATACIIEEKDKMSTETAVADQKMLPTLSAGIGPPTHRWWGPTRRIWKRLICAIKDFDMLRNGDGVLVCLSGGKDSLSLLHSMRQYQLYSKANGIDFRLGAVTIDPGSTSFDPRPLKPYLAALGGVPYFYEEPNIMQLAGTIDNLASICSFCSRMKRGTLYSCARREGYNVLALGQHLDDFAESFLMSCFCNGKIRTMKAHYSISADDGLRVIRPLVYVREKDTRHFAQLRALPVIADNCPACFEAPEMRHRIKQMLAQQELLLPNLFDSLLGALKPFISIQSVDVENELRELPMLVKYKAAYDQLYGEKEQQANIVAKRGKNRKINARDNVHNTE